MENENVTTLDNACRSEWHCFETPQKPCQYRKGEKACEYAAGMHCVSSDAILNRCYAELERLGAFYEKGNEGIEIGENGQQ